MLTTMIIIGYIAGMLIFPQMTKSYGTPDITYAMLIGGFLGAFSMPIVAVLAISFINIF